MLYFRRSPFLRRVVLPLTLLAFLSACHKWVPLEPPVAQAITEEEPGTVRVTLADNSRVVLKEPHISGDSLIAFEEGKEPQTVALLLEDLQRVEEKRANTPATIGLVVGSLGVAIGLAMLAYVIACSVDECD
jgi:hypothetical protein